MMLLKIAFLFWRPRRTFEMIKEGCEVTKSMIWLVFCIAAISCMISLVASRRFDPFYFSYVSLMLAPSWLLSVHLLLAFSRIFGGKVNYGEFVEGNAISFTPYLVGTAAIFPLIYGKAGYFDPMVSPQLGTVISIPLAVIAIWIVLIAILLLRVLAGLSLTRSIASFSLSSLTFYIIYGAAFNIYWYLA